MHETRYGGCARDQLGLELISISPVGCRPKVLLGLDWQDAERALKFEKLYRLLTLAEVF